MFTNPTATPPPRFVRVVMSSPTDNMTRGARYRIDRITNSEHGAQLEMVRIGGPESSATFVSTVRSKNLASNYFSTTRGPLTSRVLFYVTARKSG